MKLSPRFFGTLAVLLFASSVTALAAAPKIEGTPAPAAAKPDLSSMQFRMGTWTCTDLSSRRPGPFTITQVFSMDPTGYWIVHNDTIHKASWIPREFHSQTRTTYDTAAKQWVRITTGDQGGFAVSTAPNSGNNTRTYTYVVQAKAPDIASYAPEVYTKVSNTKVTMTSSFTETGGRVVTVKEVCTKT